jgi:AAA domain
MSSPSRDFVGEALSGAAVFNDFDDSDPRADVPPAESTEEFEINSEQQLSGAPRASKNALVVYPLQAFENIRLDTGRRGYLVKGLIASTGLAVIWGPPKCGKSFWAFDLGMHIALGWGYRGHKVQQAPVVYLALEGRHGFPARKEAFRRHHSVESAPFYLLTTSLDLVARSGELIASIKAQLGTALPGVIFLDTLNRSLVGSESKDEDMARFLAAAEKVTQELSCAVVIVHHCGIDASRPRGHSSLSGAVESQLAVKRTPTGEVIVTVELAKDFEEGTQIVSRLECVELDVDADGDKITSLVVLPVDGFTPQKNQRKVGGAKKTALDLLRRALTEAGSVPPASNHIPPNTRTIPMETWRAYAYQGMITESDKPDSRQKAFVRAAKQLKEADLIGVWNDQVWLTD